MTSSSTSHRGSEHWTNENRTRYDRSGLRYPSDLTDEEWAHVEPLIPPVTRGGNKRTVNTPGRDSKTSKTRKTAVGDNRRPHDVDHESRRIED